MTIDIDVLHNLLCGQILIREDGESVRVGTQVLYPSNSAVTVVIRGKTAFNVTDGGGALDEITGTGRWETPSDRRIEGLIANFGLKVSNGVIYAPSVKLESLPAAILLVANASKVVAEWAYAHVRFTVPRNFKKDLENILHRHFNESLKNNAEIVGESNKAHRFAHVIYLEHQKKLLVDPVINDASSINARVVANMDVRMRDDPTISQLIVYDDRVPWKSSDLKLLQVGTPNVVPFSASESTIQRMAA
jgi:hypothetical protein